MIYCKQLIEHDPANGSWGDCGRTALGCLLDLRPEEVPHFWNDGASGREVDDAVNEFLRPHGLYIINLSFETNDVQEALDYYDSLFHGTRYMFVGKSRLGCNHGVVAKGSSIEHDPSPQNTGIVGPCDDGTFLATILCKMM